MQSFIVLIIIIVNFILQSTIFQRIAILGVVPNTTLIIVVSLALLHGQETGGLVGLLAGFLQDILFSSTIGTNAFVYFFIGYFTGKAEQKVYKESLFMPFIFTALGTVSYYVLYYIFMYFLSKDVSFSYIFKNIGVVEIIYNSILSIFIHRWFLKKMMNPSIRFKR